MRILQVICLLCLVSLQAFARKMDFSTAEHNDENSAGIVTENKDFLNSDFISLEYRRRPTRRYRSARNVYRRSNRRAYKTRRIYRKRSVTRGRKPRRPGGGRESGFRMPSRKIRHYVNYEGITVQRPTYYPSHPAGASARCRDGSYSFSLHRRGTCSGHGGVAEWY